LRKTLILHKFTNKIKVIVKSKPVKSEIKVTS